MSTLTRKDGKELGKKFQGLDNATIFADYKDRLEKGELIVVAMSDETLFGADDAKTGRSVMFAQIPHSSYPPMFARGVFSDFDKLALEAEDSNILLTHLQMITKGRIKSLGLEIGKTLESYYIGFQRRLSPLRRQMNDNPWQNRKGDLCFIGDRPTFEYTHISSQPQALDANENIITEWNGERINREQALIAGLVNQVPGTDNVVDPITYKMNVASHVDESLSPIMRKAKKLAEA